MKHMKKILGKTGVIVVAIVAILFGLWCTLALYYCASLTFAIIYAVILLVAVVGMFFRKFSKPAIIVLAMLAGAVLGWWFNITASHNAEWQTPWARTPSAVINGNLLTIDNIRDFRYHTENDYDVRYRKETYHLDKLHSVDLVLSYWDGNKDVAHSMLDFGFSDGKWLVVSSETRLKKGQIQGALPGLFKQYQSLYIFGMESDLLMLRTNFRGEETYLYPTITTPVQARILLLDLVDRANELCQHPQFYNTITSNCSTSLVPSLRKIRPPRGWDIRILLNGLADEMTFENGWLKHAPGVSFQAYKPQHAISARMKKHSNPELYSKLLHSPQAE